MGIFFRLCNVNVFCCDHTHTTTRSDRYKLYYAAAGSSVCVGTAWRAHKARTLCSYCIRICRGYDHHVAKARYRCRLRFSCRTWCCVVTHCGSTLGLRSSLFKKTVQNRNKWLGCYQLFRSEYVNRPANAATGMVNTRNWLVCIIGAVLDMAGYQRLGLAYPVRDHGRTRPTQHGGRPEVCNTCDARTIRIFIVSNREYRRDHTLW